MMVGNTQIRETNQMETIKTVSPAVRGAALKRERKAAAVLARAAGKKAAALRRDREDAVWLILVNRGREEIQDKIAIARKAMGVCKSEYTPLSILQMIPKWESDMLMHCGRCMEEYMNNQILGKKTDPVGGTPPVLLKFLARYVECK